MQRREKSVQSVPGIGISNLPQSSGFEALAIDRPRPGIRICKKSLWWALTARAPSQFTLDLELCTVIHLPYQATHQTPTSTHQAYPAGPGPPTRRPPGDLPGTHRTAYPALTGRPTRHSPGDLPGWPRTAYPAPTRRPTRRSPDGLPGTHPATYPALTGRPTRRSPDGLPGWPRAAYPPTRHPPGGLPGDPPGDHRHPPLTSQPAPTRPTRPGLTRVPNTQPRTLPPRRLPGDLGRPPPGPREQLPPGPTILPHPSCTSRGPGPRESAGREKAALADAQ
jgi:hypothetical protein